MPLGASPFHRDRGPFSNDWAPFFLSMEPSLDILPPLRPTSREPSPEYRLDDGLDELLFDLDAAPTPTPIPPPPRLPDKKLLSVSNLAEVRHCETQLFYIHTKKRGRRTRTDAMDAGEKIHSKLETEANGPSVPIEIASREDGFAVTLLNSIIVLDALRSNATLRARELPLWARFGTRLVHGIADQIERRVAEGGPGWQFVISDTKTVGNKYVNMEKRKQGPGAFQVSLYKKMFDSMVADGASPVGMELAREVMAVRGFDPDAELSAAVLAQLALLDLQPADVVAATQTPPRDLTYTDDGAVVVSSDSPEPDPSQPIKRNATLGDVVHLYLATLATFPRSSINLELHLVNRNSSPENVETTVIPFDFDQNTFDRWLANALSFWDGREPGGVEVEEVWKCHHCEFADGCEWRIRKSEELVEQNKKRFTHSRTV